MLQTLLSATQAKPHVNHAPSPQLSIPIAPLKGTATPKLDMVFETEGTLYSSPQSDEPLPLPSESLVAALGPVISPFSTAVNGTTFIEPIGGILEDIGGLKAGFTGVKVGLKALNSFSVSNKGSQQSSTRKPPEKVDTRPVSDDFDDIVQGYGYNHASTNNQPENTNTNAINFPRLSGTHEGFRFKSSDDSQDDQGPKSPEAQPERGGVAVATKHELSREFYSRGFYTPDSQNTALESGYTTWTTNGTSTPVDLGKSPSVQTFGTQAFGEYSSAAIPTPPIPMSELGNATASALKKMRKQSKSNLKDGHFGSGPDGRPSTDESVRSSGGTLKGIGKSMRTRLNSLTGSKKTTSKEWECGSVTSDHHQQSSHGHSSQQGHARPAIPRQPNSAPVIDYRDLFSQRATEDGYKADPRTPTSSTWSGTRPAEQNSRGNPLPLQQQQQQQQQWNSTQQWRAPPPWASSPSSGRVDRGAESDGGTSSLPWLSEPPSAKLFRPQPGESGTSSPRPQGPRNRGLSSPTGQPHQRLMSDSRSRNNVF